MDLAHEAALHMKGLPSSWHLHAAKQLSPASTQPWCLLLFLGMEGKPSASACMLCYFNLDIHALLGLLGMLQRSVSYEL